MRILEALRLRVKNIDFSHKEILIRDGKGFKDRMTMLSQSLMEPLRADVAGVKDLHEQDLAVGYGSVFMPNAFNKKNILMLNMLGLGSMFFLLLSYRSIIE